MVVPDEKVVSPCEMTTERLTNRLVQGEKVAVRLATRGFDDPTGGFFNDETLFNEEGTVPWGRKRLYQ